MYKDVHKIPKELKDISPKELTDLISKDPGLFSRHFDHRIRAIFKWLEEAKPLGEINHFFRRTEYQNRGTPHVHSLIWIKNAPRIGENTDQEIIEFLNKHITCRIPDPVTEPELFELVDKFQRHRCNRNFLLTTQI